MHSEGTHNTKEQSTRYCRKITQNCVLYSQNKMFTICVVLPTRAVTEGKEKEKKKEKESEIKNERKEDEIKGKVNHEAVCMV